MQKETVNRVFEEWGNIYFSAAEKEAIAATYGAEVLGEVLGVYDALMDVGKGANGVDETLRRFGVLAGQEYFWLTDKARGQLVHALVMNWK